MTRMSNERIALRSGWDHYSFTLTRHAHKQTKMKWWNKFKERLMHWYWEGLTGEQCWDCSGLREKIRKDLPMIRKMQGERYGCPQDYKNAQDFIDSI